MGLSIASRGSSIPTQVVLMGRTAQRGVPLLVSVNVAPS